MAPLLGLFGLLIDLIGMTTNSCFHNPRRPPQRTLHYCNERVAENSDTLGTEPVPMEASCALQETLASATTPWNISYISKPRRPIGAPIRAYAPGTRAVPDA